MEGKMIFRRAEKNDIPMINNLLGQVLYVHHIIRADIFKEKGQKYTEEKLEEMIKDDDNPIFVACDEYGKVLGHCFCQIKINEETSATKAYKTMYIDDLCVDESVRGSGAGKFLYENVKKYAADNSFYNITLHAWNGNQKAIEFYEHLGMAVQQYTMEEIISK